MATNGSGRLAPIIQCTLRNVNLVNVRFVHTGDAHRGLIDRGQTDSISLTHDLRLDLELKSLRTMVMMYAHVKFHA